MTVEKLEPQEILALPLDGPGFLVSKTVGQYLMSTLRTFIRDQDGFDSKRPFGSSDWEDPLILAFAKANLIWLRTDEFEQIEDYPTAAFWAILNDLSDFLLDVDYTTVDRIPEPPTPKEWFVVYVEQGRDSTAAMCDYFREPFTEEEAKSKAESENKLYTHNPWVAVHVPSVS